MAGGSTKTETKTICDNCEESECTFKCDDCQERFCKQCCENIHRGGKAKIAQVLRSLKNFMMAHLSYGKHDCGQFTECLRSTVVIRRRWSVWINGEHHI